MVRFRYYFFLLLNSFSWGLYILRSKLGREASDMDVYWILFNPLVHDILNLIFGILFIVGLVLFVWNLLKLITSYHRTGPAIALIVCLLVIGISVRWEWFLPIIAETMGGITQYLGLYLYYMIYQYLAQQQFTFTILILSI